MQIEILYEDEDMLAINKRAGLVVHSDGRTVEPSVADWFREKYPESRDVGEPILTSPGFQPPSPRARRGAGGEVVIERPGIVHRIDRETSGVLLLAKSKKGHEVLKKQFQNREIKKVYHLFVYGDMKDDRGIIDLPIKRSKSDFRKRIARPASALGFGEAKEAVTYFEVLKRSPELGVTLVEAKPQTGRTHQIRVHFQALHHPVVGDKLYASGKSKFLSMNRLALHARKITFKNVEGKEVTVEAPYPEDFQRALDMLS